MIAKQIKGKDFYGLLAYNQKKVELGQAVVLDANIDLGSSVDMAKESKIRATSSRLSSTPSEASPDFSGGLSMEAPSSTHSCRSVSSQLRSAAVARQSSRL